MNKKLFFLAMPCLILALCMIFAGCATTPADPPGPQLNVTITGIPSQFNGKLGWIQMDTGPSRNDPTVAWAMANTAGGSITFNILDWVTDRPYSKTGNYYVSFLIWEDFNAARAPGVQPLWHGFIISKNIGENNSIAFSEFTRP